MPVLKELGAKWLVEMANFVADNPQFIVNGFVRAGITAALDNQEEDDDTSACEDDEGDIDESAADETGDDESAADETGDDLEL